MRAQLARAQGRGCRKVARALGLLGAAACCTLVAGCGAGRADEPTGGAEAPEGGFHEDPNFSKEKVLEHVSSSVLETYRDFDGAAAELVVATEAYAASLDAADLASAQASWRSAITVWQQAEIFRFGPAGEIGVAIGGQGFADEIYSWSVSTNPCRIDQETVEETFRDPTAFKAEAINVRGLDAIEYLLFRDTDANSCPVNLTLNTDGSWDARLGEIPQLRADYAYAAAVDVADNARALLTAWDPEGSDFFGSFRRAGESGSDYPSVQVALSAMGDAMFYLDVQTKDRKLGIPSGVLGCDATICPDLVESPFAYFSREHVQNNLVGIAHLMLGGVDGDTFGMLDQLRDVGGAVVADDMEARLQAAQVSVDDIQGATLTEALSSGLESVHASYEAVKALTDRMKTEFIEDLGLEITSAGPGDAD